MDMVAACLLSYHQPTAPRPPSRPPVVPSSGLTCGASGGAGKGVGRASGCGISKSCQGRRVRRQRRGVEGGGRWTRRWVAGSMGSSCRSSGSFRHVHRSTGVHLCSGWSLPLQWVASSGVGRHQRAVDPPHWLFFFSLFLSTAATGFGSRKGRGSDEGDYVTPIR